MIRITLLALALSATSVCAQTAAPVTEQVDCEDINNANKDECLAEAEGVTGFVPLIAPALGAAAAAAGLAAAAGGGSNPSTTSTVSTN
ncbi:hypothetical protein [Pelagibacterium sp.]|uniref:hypothetical protein n=1 Tax=Pelagibacterium sp. TaxID=1967288 RepID=UPI003A9273A6